MISTNILMFTIYNLCKQNLLFTSLLTRKAEHTVTSCHALAHYVTNCRALAGTMVRLFTARKRMIVHCGAT